MTENRYRLRAFVGSDGGVQRQNDMGFSTFTQIYTRRPDKCRYAVAQTENDEVWTWDLYGDDVLMSGDDMTFIPPSPLRVQPGENVSVEDKVDAAIMSAAMLAEEPD